MAWIKKYYVVYLLSWLTLAIVYITQYSQIFGKNCHFQKNWLVCREDLSSVLQIFTALLVLLFFVNLFVGGRYFWKLFNNEKIFNEKLKCFIIIFSLFLPFLIYPFGSGDITYYYSAGKATSQGINVYANSWDWERSNFTYAHTDSLVGFSYGPLMADVFSFFYRLSHDKIFIFIFLWRLFMSAILAGCGYLVLYISKMLSANFDKTKFYLFWFTQPLFLFESLVNGHFDIFWLTFVLLSFIFAHQKKWWLVFSCLTIGVWIKFIPILIMPWFALWWWQETSWKNWKLQLRGLIAGSLLSVALTLFAWQRYWVGFKVFNLIFLQSKWAVSSFFSLLYYSFERFVKFFFAGDYHWYLTRVVHAMVVLLLLYLLFPIITQVFHILMKKLQFSTIDYISASFVSLLVYMLIWQKSFWPWYCVWILPIGLVAYLNTRNVYLGKILVWLGTAPLLLYIIWFFYLQIFHTYVENELWYNLVVVLLVMAYPLYNLMQWRRFGYQNLLSDK